MLLLEKSSSLLQRPPCRDPRPQQQLSPDGKEHPDSDHLTSSEHQGCPPLGPRRAKSAGPLHQTGHCLGTPAVVGGTLWENGETETPEKTQPGQCCFIDVKTLIRPKPPTSIGRSISVPSFIHPSIFEVESSKEREDETPGDRAPKLCVCTWPNSLWAAQVWRKQNYDEADLYSASQGKT